MFAIPTSPVPLDTLIFVVCSAQAALRKFWNGHAETVDRMPYTGAEIAVLRKHYVSDGVAVCETLLPGRDRVSIVHKAHRLGIRKCERVSWSDAESRIIARHLKRGETLAQISSVLHAQGFERTRIAVRDFIASRGLR